MIRNTLSRALPLLGWTSWARIRELVSKESSGVTQEPRILRTRATSALQVDQRSDRPAQRSRLFLSLSIPFFLSPVFSSRLIPRRRRLRRMAQSRCPLAKLKYLAFGRTLKVHARGEDRGSLPTARIKRLHDLRLLVRRLAQRVDCNRSIINAGLGVTRVRDTQSEFHTTPKGKKIVNLLQRLMPYLVAPSRESTIFNLYSSRYLGGPFVLVYAHRLLNVFFFHILRAK